MRAQGKLTNLLRQVSRETTYGANLRSLADLGLEAQQHRRTHRMPDPQTGILK